MSKAEAIYKQYAPTKQPSFIIEQYMEGSHHTVQGFADKNGRAFAIDRVVDQVRASEVGFDDNFIYARILPSRLSRAEQDEVIRAVEAGITAIGMRSALAHCDVVLTKGGARLIEIGARIGGYREFMYREANGIDLYEIMLNMAYSRPLKLKAAKDFASSVIELFPKEPGKFGGVSNQEALNKLASLDKFKIRAAIGDKIGKASDGYKACATVFLKNDNPSQLKQDIDFVLNDVAVTKLA
jgi:hypothetical protein